jgi:hypothetical protein
VELATTAMHLPVFGALGLKHGLDGSCGVQRLNGSGLGLLDFLEDHSLVDVHLHTDRAVRSDSVAERAARR